VERETLIFGALRREVMTGSMLIVFSNTFAESIFLEWKYVFANYRPWKKRRLMTMTKGLSEKM